MKRYFNLMNNYKDLKVYQKSYALALRIHEVTQKFALQREASDLIDQVRRASRSIPTNIAEGYGRKESQKDFRRFLWISLGSNDEVFVHLDFLKDLGYITPEDHKELTHGHNEVGKMLYGLIQSLKI